MPVPSFPFRAVSALVLALSLGLSACTLSAANSQTPTPHTPDSAQPTPGVVEGQVLNTHGQPIAGALVWIEPALTTGLLKTSTDSSGHYRVQNPSRFPHLAKAWTRVEFGGQNFCLRLAMPRPQDFDAFTPAEGAVRNFRWQLSGLIEDLRDYKRFFGAEVRVFKSFDSDQGLEGSDRAEFSFTPIGVLVDGSVGQVVRKVEDQDMMLYDIPLGKYSVSVTVVKADGRRLAGQVGVGYSHDLKRSTELEFKPSSGCSNGSGIERAFLSYGL